MELNKSNNFNNEINNKIKRKIINKLDLLERKEIKKIRISNEDNHEDNHVNHAYNANNYKKMENNKEKGKLKRKFSEKNTISLSVIYKQLFQFKKRSINCYSLEKEIRIGEFYIVNKDCCLLNGFIYNNIIDWIVVEIKKIIKTLNEKDVYQVCLYAPIRIIYPNNPKNVF